MNIYFFIIPNLSKSIIILNYFRGVESIFYMDIKSFLFLLIVVSSISLKAQPEKYYGGTNGEKLDWALYFLNHHYVDSVNSTHLTEVAIKSMMKTLDPWSRYQTAKEVEDLHNAYSGYSDAAYGFNYFWIGDSLMIVYLNKGGPADIAGLQVNDRIVRVNETPANLTNYASVKMQLHNEDSILQLTINRPNEFTKPFTLKKAKLPLLSVDAAYMDNTKTAYVKISSFNDKTGTEFINAVKPLLQQGMQNIMIDLRGNYGGSVTGAIALCDEFLPAGKVISYSKGINLDRYDYLSTDNYLMKDISLTILIDELSMSASEMFAGAMQDYDRALIIGKESYGKGLIQRSYYFNDSSAVRFTVGKYYTPTGRYFDQMAYENKGFTKLIWNESIEEEYTINMQVPDSLMHTTLSKRKIVASPKGIVPDIYIDAKAANTKELMLLKGQHLLSTFAYHYMFNNRQPLSKKYSSVESFEADNTLEATLKQQLWEFIQQEVKEKQFDFRLVPASITDDIITETKAFIANQLWGNAAYYYMMNTRDPLIHRSKMAFTDGSFGKLKLYFQ